MAKTEISNGAASPEPDEPRLSMREIAEQAYDDVVDAAGDEPDAGDLAPGQDAQARDNRGRFVAADQQPKPGEQSNDPAPENDPKASNGAKPADPAPGSNQPPQHWPEQDRQNFAKLTPEGQAFLLRRHSEMERDYQGKTQAAATAVQFTQSIAPLFQDPIIAGSLQQARLSPFEAIGQWASFHRRALDPNPQVRVALLTELAQRMGLDPAAGGMSRQGAQGQLSEDDLKDPAIRYFAEHIGNTQSQMQALRSEMQRMANSVAERQQQEVLKVTRRSIDSFADEKDEKGNLRHPHFDAVLPTMIELYRANPERDLQEAYDMAIWSTPAIRSQLLASERQTLEQQRSNDRARLAVRGNVRGVTAPVSRPAGDGKAKGMRATIEAAADEAGM